MTAAPQAGAEPGARELASPRFTMQPLRTGLDVSMTGQSDPGFPKIGGYFDALTERALLHELRLRASGLLPKFHFQ
jgi:hypothetical protein